jgi:hypothetical protein
LGEAVGANNWLMQGSERNQQRLYDQNDWLLFSIYAEILTWPAKQGVVEVEHSAGRSWCLVALELFTELQFCLLSCSKKPNGNY